MRKFTFFGAFGIAFSVLMLLCIFSCQTNRAKCDKLWVAEINEGGSLDFRKGILELKGKDLETGPAVVLLQENLQGNFVAFLDFQDFNRSDEGNGSYLRFFIRNVAPDSFKTATVAIGDATPAGKGLKIGVFADTDGTSPEGDSTGYVTATSSSGQFSIFRNSNLVTLSASDEEGNFIDKTFAFNSDPVEIGFSIGSNLDTLSGSMSVNLSSFTVSTLAVGGIPTPVQSDDFDCYSLIE